MKIISVVLIAMSLGACSPSDQERAQREAREAADKVKADAKKVGNEVDRDLRNSRDKLHQEMDQHR